jgi:lysylphosphatidylglycerol synthetase-like protein (DUF2156 family)
VGDSQRLSVPLPYGQRAYVLSDLDLNPSSDPEARSVREFVELLNEIDDAAIVIVAGNFFLPPASNSHPLHGMAPDTFVTATLEHLGAVREALQRFGLEPYRRCIWLPGTADCVLARDANACRVLELAHVEIAHDVMLQVATTNGARDISIVTGAVTSDTTAVDVRERRDAQHLEDPSALSRFAASRLLYRRLAKWIWFPLWALVLIDFASSIVAVANRITHRHVRIHATRPDSVWTTIVFDLLIVAAFEAVLAAIAGWVVHRRFSTATRSSPHSSAEPLAATTVDGVDALQYARRIAERGGAGAIIGGAPRPGLVFLGDAVCAAPGPSREAVIERRARFGLPPVFSPVLRLGIVEIEAATMVRVRLLAGQSPLSPATRLERWLGSTPRQPEPEGVTSALSSWPNGDPWPLGVDRISSQLRQRLTRRWASSLLLLTGIADVVVAAAPRLHAPLHMALSILPIGVVQGATAVTAIAGFAMIMMARGVRRGQRRAWLVAVVMLLVTVGAHLARGGKVGSTLLALVVLAILLFQRESFSAATDRSSLESALPRLGLVAVVSVLAATISIEFTHRHHVVAAWPTVALACFERMVGITTIALPEGVSDYVDPTMLSLGVALIVTSLYLITRPVVDRRLSQRRSPTEQRIAHLRARDIVRRHGRGTLDYFALRDDKQHYFHRDSLVAYAVFGGVALISPDPIGPRGERSEVFSAFRTFSEQNGWTVGVIGAGEEWLAIYQSAGLHHIYLGDEAVVNCQEFSLQGGKMKGLRQACTRLERNGYTVHFFDPSEIDPSEVTGVVNLISKLRRGEAERGFSMMLGRIFNPKDQGLLLTIVKDPKGQPAAVCQFVPSPAISGYSLDLMRRDPDEHPNGLIDYALCSTIQELAQRGARGLSLNFAAFRSVLDGEKGDGTLTRIERWALKRLSGILPIESLWSFNAKYDPAWLPRYIVYPAAESFVPVVAAILRAESLTEIPVIGRLLASDPSNRPGTVVPDEILEQARAADALK